MPGRLLNRPLVGVGLAAPDHKPPGSLRAQPIPACDAINAAAVATWSLGRPRAEKGVGDPRSSMVPNRDLGLAFGLRGCAD